MQVLGRVIPAVRETRIPLITGLLWLLGLWLFVSSRWDSTAFFDELDEPTSLAGRLDTALRAFGPLGIGLVVSASAYLLGSLSSFVWDRILEPLDNRATRERATRTFSEAQLRLQLVPPVSLVLILIGPLGVLSLAWSIPALLGAHGAVLWRQAKRTAMRSDLRGADLSSANLAGANFSHSDLSGANLQGANLQRARLESTTIDHAQLNGARLGRVVLAAVGSGLTDTHLRQIDSGKRVDLRAADLRDANLRNAELPKADLRGADLHGAQLQGANLRGAKLTEDTSRRRFVDLSKARLIEAELRGADLTGADLSDADLNGATMRRVRLVDANLVRADLSGCDLRVADLRGADLVGANLAGARLEGALLEGSSWEKVDWDPANLPTLPNGYRVPARPDTARDSAAPAPLAEYLAELRRRR